MTNLEKQQWNQLYDYVKKDILHYDDKQSIPQQLILRLKGLQSGKLIANRSTKDNAEYSYEVILIAFKMSKSKIDSALYGKSFASEMQKFLYICAIVETEINDVYLRLQKVQRSFEKIESIDTDVIQHEGAEYKPKTDKVNDRLKNIW